MDRNQIVIASIITLVALVGLSAGVRHLVNKTRRRRRSDKKLSARERKIFLQAKTLFDQRKTKEAGQLLESIGLYREAVNLLQDSGEIAEAASVLLRLGRPNRAGVVYTRHGYWQPAMECFKAANMPLEVARCAREAGQFPTAAKYFLKVKHFTEAAECFVEAKEIRQAARYFALGSSQTKAIDCYLRFLESDPKPTNMTFEPDELEFLTDVVIQGNTAAAFAEVLEVNDRLTGAIASLVRFGNMQGATKLYTFAKREIDSDLIAEVGADDGAGENLAELFKHLNKPLLAAKAFERAKLIEKAADCYVDAGSYQDASRCYKSIDKQNPAPEDSRTAEDEDSDEGHALAEATMAMVTERVNKIASYETTAEDPADNQGSNLPDEQPRATVQPNQNETQNLVMDEAFARCKILYDLKQSEKEAVWKLGATQAFEAGQVLLEHNETPAGICFVLSGAIEVRVGPNSINEGRREVYPGETFAAHWAFLDELVDAKFTAKERTEVCTVTREALQELLDKNGTLARKLYKNMTRQVRFTFLTNRNIKNINKAS